MVSGFGLRSLLRWDRFMDDELEARFQGDYQRPIIEACHLWAIVEVVTMLTNAYGALYSLLRPILSIPYWALYSVQICCVVAVLCAARSAMPVHRLRTALCASYCLSLTAFAAQLCLGLWYYQQQGAFLPSMGMEVASNINGIVVYLLMIYFYLLQQPLTVPLLHVGFCPVSLLSVLWGPTVYLLMATVGMPLQTKPLAMFPAILLIVGVQVFYCRRHTVLRRSVFVLQLQKARHAEEMREVDAAINHTIKNTMAEAAGLTDMFLDLCTPPPPVDFVKPYLHCALERLRSGMAWCKRHQVLTELMNRESKPHRVPTSLKALGMALVSHCTVVVDFADLQVELDEALTDLLLETAISNAFRHGHPTDPAVHFRIAAVPDVADGHCKVTFRITNRADPTQQAVPADILDQLRRINVADPTRATVACHGMGLRQSLLAAELQGMTVSLTQEGETVVFEATVVATQVVPRPSSPASPSSSRPPACAGATAPLPAGLCIAVIDDSTPARTLLRHQLCQDIPGCTVEAFGASAEDVEPFLNYVLAAADIAILDQHLDWPSGRPGLGTDLVWQLRLAGFCGLICIRSANTSDLDTRQYFAAGAHCVLDKLLDRAQTTATLATHYRRFFSQPPSRPSPEAEPKLQETLPGFVSAV